MNFSSNFFLKSRFFGFFRELHVRKFRKFSPDHFYNKKFQFYDKKKRFSAGYGNHERDDGNPGSKSETTVTDFPFDGFN